MVRLWIWGLLQARLGRLLGTVAGVALTVALMASLGTFLRTSAASMTARAVASLPVDWQVQTPAGGERSQVQDAVEKAAPLQKSGWMGFADVQGLEAVGGGTVQTTGPGKALGLDRDYIAAFPGQVRLLVGSLDGVLAAQQTAANLHVAVGDAVILHRTSLPDATVTISGVVELPNADALFQAVGMPPGAAPQAPPDNVLLFPATLWHEHFDAQAAARPDTVRDQFHFGLAHAGLPSSPAAAYDVATRQGHNFEARAAGAALLANNLAVRLGGVREDALYATVLFLFLGAPGAVMAVLLTLAVTASGTDRRRRDEALLKMRGATLAQIVTLTAAEAVGIGIAGAFVGLGLAELASRLLWQASVLAPAALPWLSAAAGVGVLSSVAAILLPAWHRARHATVAGLRRALQPERPPVWSRACLDIALLALAGVAFWRSAETGYQVVLAPEGVTATAVDYTAFLAPVLLWAGLGLFSVRAARQGLVQGRGLYASLLTPFAGPLSAIIASATSRQTGRLTVGIALTTLAFAFASSTAIFNTTYQVQARIDAELTNGADVTVTGTSAAPASDALGRLRSLPGVIAAEPMQHRYAYVGADLQDLYGINPSTIGQASTMSDAYFANGDAAGTLARLRETPDGVLVSQETVDDYQLQPGDEITMRLQHAVDHQYRAVPFRFIGVAREFPTAPKDSFIVANASYVEAKTRSPGHEVVLMRVSGDPGKVSAAVGEIMASSPGARVSDVTEARRLIASSLTAVDLSGLTRLELGFALLVVAASAGLVLGLGLADRRRSLAILTALGAKPHQLAAFVWSEAALVIVGGSVLGILSGWAIAAMLVKLLTGVFDPPPESLAVPFTYLAVLLGVAVLAVGTAVLVTLKFAQANVVESLRAQS